ncbi:hypothetical protein L9F63_027182, partial [Diploptera punctata]
VSISVDAERIKITLLGKVSSNERGTYPGEETIGLTKSGSARELRSMRWLAYSIMDSSRVSTFLISILLIVYGSFRSLNMEQEAREREKEKERAQSLTGLPAATTGPGGENNVQTLDTMQALCLPLGASISLLVMFFFFDSMQMLFAICTAIIATVALAFLLLPMCQYVIGHVLMEIRSHSVCVVDSLVRNFSLSP